MGKKDKMNGSLQTVTDQIVVYSLDELLKLIKADPIMKFIPIVVLTSSNEDSDMIESCRLGVNSYIVKPVDFDKFIESVRNIGFYWLLLNKQPDIKNLLK